MIKIRTRLYEFGLLSQVNSAKSVQMFAINCQQDPFTVNLALVTVPKCLRILVSEQVSD